MDVLTKEQRARCMSRVRGKDTTPELRVRRMLHRLGYRFRLHKRNLPGRPDITLTRHGLVIFVHGCFWHGHEGCPRSKRPTTNTEFWNTKLDRNAQRDRANRKTLESQGWRVATVWECETRTPETLHSAVLDAVGSELRD